MSFRTFAYRSFWPRKEDVARFASFGVHTVCIYPSNTLNSLGIPYSAHPPHWLHRGVYDWPALDRQFDEVLEANPQARILCMIDLNTPGWLVRFNPPLFEDSFTQLGKIVADETWRRETTVYLRDFLRQVEGKYGDKVDSYMLSCGGTCEWQDMSRGGESSCRRAAWRTWCTERGFPDPVDIPAASVRDHATHELLRDPVKDAWGLRYWDFVRWAIGDAILYFAAETQALLKHRVPLGMFYGYLFEHPQGRLLNEGHLDFDRVYASTDLDFFTAPASYHDRDMGGGGGIMVPLASLHARGKGFLQEIDHRTHTANANPLKSTFGVEWGSASWGWKTEAESLAGLKREFACALLNGTALWWFDMWNHWYDSDAIRELLGKMKRIWEEHHAAVTTSAAEVAVVVDAESALYLDQADPRVTEVYYRLRPALNRIGASYDQVSFDDLENLDTARYRMFVFPGQYVVDDRRMSILKRKVFNENRAVIWRDRPGVIREGRYNLANVQTLTGLSPNGQVQEKAMGSWTSILEPLIPWDTARLRSAADKAGVHLWSREGEPVFSGGNLFAVHTARGGKRHYHLPHKAARVRELFGNALVAEDAREFKIELGAPDTKLFLLEGVE